MKQIISIGLLVWFGAGFLCGAMDTLDSRAGSFETVDGKLVRMHQKSGCTYNSLVSVLSVGYVASCELFRKRFEYEGIDKVWSASK